MDLNSSKKRLLIGVFALLAVVLLILFVKSNTSPAPLEELTENAVTEAGENKMATPPSSQAVPKTTSTKTVKSVTPVKTSSRGCTLSLTVSKNEQLRALVPKWNACSSADFQLYTLYRNNAVIHKSSNKNLANYVDKNLVSGSTYTYKVCVSQKLSPVTCSNTVSFKF